MRSYIIRRLLLVIPTVFLASLIVFIIIRLIPGDVIDIMIANIGTGYGRGVDLVRADITEKLGLDVPLFVQFGHWLGNIVLHGDLGKSIWTDSPIIDEIAVRWPVTFELGFFALIISQLLALPIGIFSALRQDTWGDYIARSFSIICISVPSFWIGTMVVVFPSLWWGYAPPVELIHFTEDPLGNLGQFLVPATVMGLYTSGGVMRMVRTMMLEVLRQDYIRTAWAKGLRERVVVVRHALKNAMIPVVTILGMQLGMMVGGTVIIESIFCLPGMGQLIVTATNNRDYTVVSGTMLFFAVAMVLINLFVDLTYSFLDPRVKYQ